MSIEPARLAILDIATKVKCGDRNGALGSIRELEATVLVPLRQTVAVDQADVDRSVQVSADLATAGLELSHGDMAGALIALERALTHWTRKQSPSMAGA